MLGDDHSNALFFDPTFAGYHTMYVAFLDIQKCICMIPAFRIMSMTIDRVLHYECRYPPPLPPPPP